MPIRLATSRLAAIVLLFAGASHGCAKQLPCPTPPPDESVTVTGDGKLVSAALGAAGGELTLGPGLPALQVPAGALPASGRMIALKLVAEGRPGGPVGRPASIAFEVNPPTEAELEHAFVVSGAIGALPAGCTGERLRLAVERPSDVGAGAPTLRWDYDPVVYVAPTASVSLVRLHGQRMQFVCLEGLDP